MGEGGKFPLDKAGERKGKRKCDVEISNRQAILTRCIKFLMEILVEASHSRID